MSPRVFLAALAQETNVFGPLPTGLGSFTGRFSTSAGSCDGLPPFPEALLASLSERSCAGSLQLVAGPIAGAQPSGVVTRAAFETLRDAILRELAAALPVDIIAFHLHGAMIADGYADCEGDLLARAREVAGPVPVIGALLDPHAHLSAAMLCATDVMIAYKEYPHVDFRERAEELVRLLLKTHAGTVRPASAVCDAGVIGIFHTNEPDVRALVGRMQGWEASGEALSVSLIHGFPWADTPDLGTRALVICDDDPAAAGRLAKDLAMAAQAVALQAPSRTTPLEEAIRRLRETTAVGRPVVWADAADNPGGGAAGDSTYVLAALLAAKISGACLGPLWDPAAVDVAFNAGVGAHIGLRIGGKTGPQSGAPLDIRAQVLALESLATQTFAGAPFAMGRAAALRCDGVDVVVISERDQARGTDLFLNLGIDPSAKRVVVVKSSQHFQQSFAPIAAEIVYLDCPGSLQLNLSRYPFERIARPRWPIDATAATPWHVASHFSPLR